MGPRAAAAAPAVAAGLDQLGPSGAWTLGKLGPTASIAVPALVRMLSKDEAWKWSVFDTLETIGPPARDAVPAMVAAWLRESPDDRDPASWHRRAVRGILAVEPDGRSLLLQIQRLREALLYSRD